MDPVSAAGIALAIPGLIDLCVKYADFIADKIHDAKHSAEQIDFRQLNIQGKLKDVKFHLYAFKQLTPEELTRFEFDIEELSLSIDALKAKLESMERRPSGWRWAAMEKKKVDSLLTSIQQAHASLHSKLNLVLVERLTFGTPDMRNVHDCDGSGAQPPELHYDRYQITTPSVFAKSIVRRNNHVLAPVIPVELERRLGDAKVLRGSAIKTLPNARGGFYIVEERGCRGLESTQKESTIARIRDVAATLQQSDPAYRQWISEQTCIAHCIGFISNDDTDKLHLLFSTNSLAKSVHSLRALLLRPERGARPIYTLNEKLELARMVATAVLNTHNYRYVHKNIRPSNILCITEFKDGESRSNAQRASLPFELGRALLVGYSDAREASAGTERLGPQHVADEIYIHSSRGNEDAERNTRHTFLHDVYSLGVCLLEIGLWESFLVPADEQASTWVLNVKAFSFLKQREGVEKPDFLKEVQIHFEELARYQLPRRMGQKYADAVLECLTRLEGRLDGIGERARGDEDLDNSSTGRRRVSGRDNVELGLNYIDRVMARLVNISM